jgi:hypothetical protein
VSNKPFEDSTTDDPGSMVKISDKTDYTRFVRPTSEDEGIWLDHEEVHLVKHPVGQVKEMHVHDPTAGITSSSFAPGAYAGRSPIRPADCHWLQPPAP